jgi:hypothetical protein
VGYGDLFDPVALPPGSDSEHYRRSKCVGINYLKTFFKTFFSYNPEGTISVPDIETEQNYVGKPQNICNNKTGKWVVTYCPAANDKVVML